MLPVQIGGGTPVNFYSKTLVQRSERINDYSFLHYRLSLTQTMPSSLNVVLREKILSMRKIAALYASTASVALDAKKVFEIG